MKLVKCLSFLVALLACASCGLPGLRAYDALQREQLARYSHEAAETVREAVVDSTPDVAEKVIEAVKVIQENTIDQIDRARLAQKDHRAKPRKLPEPRSLEDNAKFNAYAGKVEDKEAVRRIVKELPGKIGGGVAWVVKEMIPRWILWTIGIVAFVSVGGLSWVVIIWRRARQGLRAMIQLANRPETKEHFKGTTNGPVRREYRRMRDKGLL